MSTPEHTTEEGARVVRQMEQMRAIEARICDAGFAISHVTGRVPLPGKPLSNQANDRPSTVLFTDTVTELIHTGRFLGRECTPGHYLTKGWEITTVLGYIPSSPAPGASVLNVGGGSTLINFHLASLGYEVVSIDKCERDRALIDNENTIAQALALRQSAHDADFLTWESGRTFDFVISICVIEHLPTREMQAAFLRGMVHRAHPGGLVLLTFGFGPRATTNPYKTAQEVEKHIYANLNGCEIVEPFAFSGVWAVSDQHTWGFVAARKSPT